ncbi:MULTISPECIES: class I SAM-dependent methyltransferase [Paenibacillus]|uniref:class I SAM-dependent methyltransferase n=1 Tax=Paenibacillus TaxID=44249 RepID=UPI0022B8D330|nr:class I SAM-dependent methyltransferase [Paenibacillus caseinilyticus]MCZ8522044.1 class I SAM-dependent methyltransferase [Paenibacillus caseinilyticus]
MTQVLSAVFIGILLLAALSIVYASWKNGITPMPSSALVRQAAAREVGRFPEHLRVVEAGSGWGQLVLQLARLYPDRRLVGIENSPIPYAFSRAAAAVLQRLQPDAYGGAGSGRITFLRRDLYGYPYEGADLVVCYLFPGAMQRLSGIFRQRLQPGTRVVSIYFALPGWTAERVVTCRDLHRTKVYVYRVP